MSEKLVSVLMSTFNEMESEVQSAINSILQQTYGNLEFIIVLDAPDNKHLRELLVKFSEEDYRVKLIINEKNIGLPLSLNKALAVARGNYIARMDADDVSFLDRLEKQVSYLEEYNLDLVATNRVDVNESGMKYQKGSLPSNHSIEKILPLANFITHPSVLMKSSVIKSVGGYRDFLSSQDYDLWLRILSSNYKIGTLDEPLLYYKIRENGISQKNRYKQYLLSKYQRYLYKERKKTGKDSYNKENLHAFLEAHNYNNLKFRQAFNKSYASYEEGITKIKSRSFFEGVLLITRSICLNKSFLYVITNNFRYQFLKMYYKKG
ncbi:glycosyltransferase involved in cell wall biosynthesis [Rossellomorea marisflavi]